MVGQVNRLLIDYQKPVWQDQVKIHLPASSFKIHTAILPGNAWLKLIKIG